MWLQCIYLTSVLKQTAPPKKQPCQWVCWGLCPSPREPGSGRRCSQQLWSSPARQLQPLVVLPLPKGFARVLVLSIAAAGTASGLRKLKMYPRHLQLALGGSEPSERSCAGNRYIFLHIFIRTHLSDVIGISGFRFGWQTLCRYVPILCYSHTQPIFLPSSPSLQVQTVAKPPHKSGLNSIFPKVC